MWSTYGDTRLETKTNWIGRNFSVLRLTVRVLPQRLTSLRLLRYKILCPNLGG